MATQGVVFVVAPDGTTSHLVDPVSERIGAAVGPKVSTKRSSHVESWHDLSHLARQFVLEHNTVMASVMDDHLYDMNSSEDITNHFFADMLPVHGPVLGPYKNYEEAIAAEIAYLQRENLPCS